MLNALYVSYDGALDPLGASQVVPYLESLAKRDIRFTLVSFEKPGRLVVEEERRALADRLARSGIRWRPLAYHRTPRLLMTAWDIANGIRTVRAAVHEDRASVVHCRGDVAMLMARGARLGPRVKRLYDPRGLFADERADTGSWRRGGWLDRAVRRVERDNLASAHGLVVLTRAVLPTYRERRPELPPHRVIPTCVDVVKFTPRAANAPTDFGLAYVGSLGTWYLTREMVEFARVAAAVVKGRVLFLTPDAEQARRAGATSDWAEVRSVPPHEVPAWLRRARALFFFIAPLPAKRASCPTKLGEGLATGIPVLTNPGIGDVEEVVTTRGVGVLTAPRVEGYQAAAERLNALIADPGTAERCRQTAVDLFSLEAGARSYYELYSEISDGTVGHHP